MRIVYKTDSMALAARELQTINEQLDIAILSLQQALARLDNMDGRKIRMLADALRTRLRQARALNELIGRKAARLTAAIDIMEGAEREITAIMVGAVVLAQGDWQSPGGTPGRTPGTAQDPEEGLGRWSFTWPAPLPHIRRPRRPHTGTPVPFISPFHRIPRIAISPIILTGPAIPLPLIQANVILPRWLQMLTI